MSGEANDRQAKSASGFLRLTQLEPGNIVPGVFTPVLLQRRIRTGATGHVVGKLEVGIPELVSSE